jgi:hypothetical protein
LLLLSLASVAGGKNRIACEGVKMLGFSFDTPSQTAFLACTCSADNWISLLLSGNATGLADTHLLSIPKYELTLRQRLAVQFVVVVVLLFQKAGPCVAALPVGVGLVISQLGLAPPTSIRVSPFNASLVDSSRSISNNSFVTLI